MKLNLLLIIGIILLFSNCNIAVEDENDFTENDFAEQFGDDDSKSEELDKLEDKMEEVMGEGQEDKNLKKEIIIIKADGAKSVKVEIKVGACRLNLSSGAKELFKGGFAYTQEKWKPIIIYNVKNNIGFFSIEQPSNTDMNFDNDDQYVWNLKFTEKLPIDFNIEIGAGISEIKLSDLKISNLNMVTGVGKTELDLRGNWKQNTEIHLNGGIGYTKVYLPDNVGVKLNIIKGLGEVDVENMTKKSSKTYTNELYGNSKLTINIYIKTGIGKVEVE